MVEYIQPDGSIITIKLKGDGNLNWAETSDGITLVKDDSGFYYYAEKDENKGMKTGSYHAKNPENRSKEERRYIENLPSDVCFSANYISGKLSNGPVIKSGGSYNSFPTIGEQNLLVILVNFQDVQFTLPTSEFDSLFNQPGYSKYGMTGSVYDYFTDNSNGKLKLNIDVVGPYTLSEARAFYGGNVEGRDQNPTAMSKEAVYLANGDVDYTKYDNDNDGKVDGLYILYAGHGEEAGASSDAIWAHKWELIPQINLDGVYLNYYSCSAELSGNSGENITGIGVICHEFLHVCGLPDLYDTDYSGSGGQSFDVGPWDPMGSGTWNNQGKTPSMVNAYSRSVLGWSELDTLVDPKSVQLRNTINFTDGYLLPTLVTDEFFVFESRKLEKWDEHLPNSGMLIYHIDLNNPGWDNNTINTVPDNQGFDLIEADASLTAGSMQGDPFPGKQKVISINGSSTPGLVTKDGTPLNHSISGIYHNDIDGIIHFNFDGGDNLRFDLAAYPVSNSELMVEWTSVTQDSVFVVVNTVYKKEYLADSLSIGDTLISGGVLVHATNNSESLLLEQLKSGTRYYIHVFKKDTFEDYYSELVQATTYTSEYAALPFEDQFTDLNAWSTHAFGGHYFQGWEVGYFQSGMVSDDFQYAFINSYDFGVMGEQDAILVSPLFDMKDFDSLYLSFDHYYKHYQGSEASLAISEDAGRTWTPLAIWNETTANAEKFSLNLTDNINNADAVRIGFRYKGQWGYHWTIDNVLISEQKSTSLSENLAGHSEHSLKVYPNPVADFTQITAENPFEEIIIINSQGVVVMRIGNVNIDNPINISQLTPGLYIVKTVDEKGKRLTARLIKI
jgi:M6 family metalloprotease-like protein